MKWIVAYVLGIAVSVLLAVCIGFLFNGLNKEKAFVCLAIGLATAIFIILKYKLSSGLEKEDFGFWSWMILVFFILFSLRTFLWLLFRRGDGLNVLCTNSLGDMPYHMTYIKYFANGAKFWPDNPIFTGDKIRYHFGIDLFNSLLVLVGVDLIRSLIWVGLLSSLASGFLLLVWGRAFTLAGFLFNGGLAGFKFLQNFIFADYQTNLDWKSIPLAMFVPQRPWLYAIPAGLLLLWSWRNKFFSSEENKKQVLPIWIEILIYSTMPLFQIHTFIFLSMLLGIWIFIVSISKRAQILKLILLSFPGATLFILLLTDSFRKSSMIHLDLEYLHSVQSFLKYWIFNFGVLWILIIWLCYKLFRKRYSIHQASTAFVFPGVITFILFSFVIMSSWKYDNAKLLMWSYLILLPYLWKELLSHWDEFSRYVICFLLFFSGFVCVTYSLDKHHGYEIFRFSEVNEVEQAVKNLPIENRFACFPTYNHPLSFCGRKMVLGYPGWIWVHGFNMEGRDEKLKRLMLGENNWRELAKELGVRYIFWGERESREYTTSIKPWESSARKIFDGRSCQIYDLESM